MLFYQINGSIWDSCNKGAVRLFYEGATEMEMGAELSLNGTNR